MNGTILNGRYRIDSKIGEGGFGAVYRGLQLATNRPVALKLLHPQMATDQNLVARFRREGEVSCNLHDAHTITTIEFDQTADGTLFIAMELLEGRSLTSIFKEQKPLDWRRMMKVVVEMCSSLGEAHAQGIVHRDLKPDNVYLESRPGNPEFVKVLDFGMAKIVRGDAAADPNAPKLTAMGQTLGTLEYMSPEQLMGAQALDSRSDIYALGVLAYEMMTGQLPFPDIKQPVALMMAQLKQTPAVPSSIRPGIPAEIDAIVMRCLDRHKDARFATVGELANAISVVMPVPVAAQPQYAAPPQAPYAPHAQMMMGGQTAPPQQQQLAMNPNTHAMPPGPPPQQAAPMAMHTAAAPAKSGKGMLFAIVGIVVLGAIVAIAVAMK